jgi:hypothetical protein
MFGQDDLKKLVECAGQALEKEDEYLTACAQARAWNGGPIGLRANTNERYYQFVIWRALMQSFRWRPQTEGMDRNDLVFWDGESNALAGVAEIKGWWSTGGLTEIPGIKSDLAKLKASSLPGVMLILTHNPKSSTETNLGWLAKYLSVDQDEFVIHRFDTPPWHKLVVGQFELLKK